MNWDQRSSLYGEAGGTVDNRAFTRVAAERDRRRGSPGGETPEERSARLWPDGHGREPKTYSPQTGANPAEEALGDLRRTVERFRLHLDSTPSTGRTKRKKQIQRRIKEIMQGSSQEYHGELNGLKSQLAAINDRRQFIW